MKKIHYIPLVKNLDAIFSTDFSFVAILCIPSNRSDSALEREGMFDLSTVEFLECGVDLKNVVNSSNERLLPQLSVLTSRPVLLTEEDIATAVDVLRFYLTNSQEQVNDGLLIIDS